MMNPEAKELWLAALRSGKFKQSRGTMRSRSGYCCLGVLAEVMGVPPAKKGSQRFDFAQRGQHNVGSYPPVNFQGIDWENRHFLVDMNDDEKKTFPEIADWIEANL